MKLYEKHDDYLIYQYDENEFFEWEEDIKLCMKNGILISEFKQYGQPFYFIIVDFTKFNHKRIEAN